MSRASRDEEIGHDFAGAFAWSHLHDFDIRAGAEDEVLELANGEDEKDQTDDADEQIEADAVAGLGFIG